MSMRVVWSVGNLDIELQENKITVITIENTEAYVDFLMNLNLQAEGQAGTIIVSDGVKEQNFVKSCDVIFNPFALELNSKKVLTKLYQELQEIADTVCQEKYIQVKSVGLRLWMNLQIIVHMLLNLIWNLKWCRC